MSPSTYERVYVIEVQAKLFWQQIRMEKKKYYSRHTIII